MQVASNGMKALARVIFGRLAAMIRRRYQPTVVGVAGSVGKTATKDAIAASLDDGHGNIRHTIGSFNAEIGVPVTILSGGKARTTIGGWLNVLWSGIRLLVRRSAYPKFLVLELGADKPGDLAPLLRVASPNIGVLTSIAPEHMEFFGTLSAVAAEESQVVTSLPSDGTAILNADDANIAGLQIPGRILRYGWLATADIRGQSLELIRNGQGRPTGMDLTVDCQGERLAIEIRGVVGRHQTYPILAAIAVAQATGQSIPDTVSRLRNYQAPPGRMRVFAGVDESLVIDDSYNASPEAMLAALQALADLDVRGKKYAILGQMSELGAGAVDWHERIGRRAAEVKLDGIVTLGALADRIGRAAVAAGLPAAHVINVETAEAAALHLKSNLQAGDAILVKGSRYPKPGYAGHLEAAVAVLLAYPERDRAQLVQG